MSSQALHSAVLAGEAERVAELSRNGGAVNALDGQGRNVVVCAILGEDTLALAASTLPILSAPHPVHEGILTLLLALPAPNALSVYTLNAPCACVRGVTPLSLAAWLGKTQVVEKLVKCGRVLVDGRDRNGATALMYAARDDHLDIVSLLLAHGADPSLTDANGFSSVQYALPHRRVVFALETALRSHRHPSPPAPGPSNIVSLHSSLLSLRAPHIPAEPPELINERDEQGLTPFHRAVRTEGVSLSALDTLFRSGADVNVLSRFGRSALHLLALASNSPVGLKRLSAPPERPPPRSPPPSPGGPQSLRGFLRVSDAGNPWPVIVNGASAHTSLTSNTSSSLLVPTSPALRSNTLIPPPSQALLPPPFAPTDLPSPPPTSDISLLVKHLVENFRMRTDTVDAFGETALHLAAEHGSSTDLVRVLLELDNSADVRGEARATEKRNERGLTPREVARDEFVGVFEECEARWGGGRDGGAAGGRRESTLSVPESQTSLSSGLQSLRSKRTSSSGKRASGLSSSLSRSGGSGNGGAKRTSRTSSDLGLPSRSRSATDSSGSASANGSGAGSNSGRSAAGNQRDSILKPLVGPDSLEQAHHAAVQIDKNLHDFEDAIAGGLIITLRDVLGLRSKDGRRLSGCGLDRQSVLGVNQVLERGQSMALWGELFISEKFNQLRAELESLYLLLFTSLEMAEDVLAFWSKHQSSVSSVLARTSASLSALQRGLPLLEDALSSALTRYALVCSRLDAWDESWASRERENALALQVYALLSELMDTVARVQDGVDLDGRHRVLQVSKAFGGTTLKLRALKDVAAQGEPRLWAMLNDVLGQVASFKQALISRWFSSSMPPSTPSELAFPSAALASQRHSLDATPSMSTRSRTSTVASFDSGQSVGPATSFIPSPMMHAFPPPPSRSDMNLNMPRSQTSNLSSDPAPLPPPTDEELHSARTNALEVDTDLARVQERLSELQERERELADELVSLARRPIEDEEERDWLRRNLLAESQAVVDERLVIYRERARLREEKAGIEEVIAAGMEKGAGRDEEQGEEAKEEAADNSAMGKLAAFLEAQKSKSSLPVAHEPQLLEIEHAPDKLSTSPPPLPPLPPPLPQQKLHEQTLRRLEALADAEAAALGDLEELGWAIGLTRHVPSAIRQDLGKISRGMPKVKKGVAAAESHLAVTRTATLAAIEQRIDEVKCIYEWLGIFSTSPQASHPPYPHSRMPSDRSNTPPPISLDTSTLDSPLPLGSNEPRSHWSMSTSADSSSHGHDATAAASGSDLSGLRGMYERVEEEAQRWEVDVSENERWADLLEEALRVARGRLDGLT